MAAEIRHPQYGRRERHDRHTDARKPIYGEAGNGMHVHMLLRKNGQPVFYDPDAVASSAARPCTSSAALLKHARSLCAITNPSTNSYKRLIPGFEAPVTIGYAMANRSAVVRIPAYVKSPDQETLRAPQPGRDVQPVLCLRCHSDGRPRRY